MDATIGWIIGIILLMLTALLVGTEYALISSRRSRVDSDAQKSSRAAKNIQQILNSLPRYVASVQVGITISGLALGATTEPLLSRSIEKLFPESVPKWIPTAIALILVTMVTVILGELIPKLIALKMKERLAYIVAGPFRIIHFILSPIAYVTQVITGFILRPFGIRADVSESDAISREELALLLRAGGDEGMLESTHAGLLNKALRFDKLDVQDIMVHRVDIEWLDVAIPGEEILGEIAKIPHSRVPVCREDIDDIVGILYLHDVVKAHATGKIDVEKLLRPAIIVPENLTLTKVVERMREDRTQILIVADEFGGTSGLITLEDVIEEVFGELEDAVESERPQIQQMSTLRYSVRADVRYDELLDFFGEPTDDQSTDTLAQIIIDNLGRMPRLGDQIELEVGKLVVENMARRRITRVRVLKKAREESHLEP